MKQINGFLFFWGSSDIYSNWYPSEFTLGGKTYPHVEQYMMAAKARIFKDFETEAEILQQPDQKAVKALGRKVKGFDKAIWVKCREKVVFDGCFAKFSQNFVLAKTIMATGALHLVEASPYDDIYGIKLSADDPRAIEPGQWKGLNLLGNALMRVRTELQIKYPSGIN